MLNGVPGRWITCRRGLRQGDPLSPYLFIIVADVLQRLIRCGVERGELQHPIDATLSCPVLQYADDTLILMKGDVASMTVLKRILEDFSAATGLMINFHKSTFVPMHVDATTAAEMAEILGCSVSSFPQTYLGLPLSPHKLKFADYQPLLLSFDRYLAGWKAKLLSTGGRIVLVNSVLGSLPIYYMSSILLPKKVVEALDAKRRAFLWTGEERCHGSSCLVAWTDVCQPKEFGGLGVKNLTDMNHCLLLKFVHKLHDPEPLPWKQWFLSHSDLSREAARDSYLGKLISHELQRYQNLTRVRVGTGDRTSFWHDRWLFNTPLCDVFPALYSHVLSRDLTVRAVLDIGLHAHLRPRLTYAARADESVLQSCLEQAELGEGPDTRLLHASDWGLFNTRGGVQSHAGRSACCGRAEDLVYQTPH